MGAGIGLEYALLEGSRVTYLARDVSATRGRLEHTVADLRRLGLHSDTSIDMAMQRITVLPLDDPHEDADVVVESLPEILELKREVLASIVRRHPRAILTTNTSSLPIESIGGAVGAEERTVGTHYLYPPLLMPLVELIPAPATAPDVVERTRALLTRMRKHVIVVRDVKPGFVWNRLQFALLREAVDLVEAGVVSAEDIDIIMTHGLGRRWRSMGPLTAAHAGGVATFVQAAREILPTLSTRTDIDGLQSLDVAPPSAEELEAHVGRLADDAAKNPAEEEA